MAKALIKIVYRQIMDNTSQDNFSKNILLASYHEFLLKSQAYNKEGKFKTFSELKANDGRANSLHYKCSFAIGGFIEKLNKQIPFIKDSLEQPVSFDIYKLEIIESDITNIASHKIAVHYITDTLTYFDLISDYMVLAKGDYLKTATDEPSETFLLKLQDGVSIHSYKELLIG